MSFMKGDLRTKARLLVKGNIMSKPRWLDAVERIPPVTKLTKAKRPPKIRYPEDRLVESYIARHPESTCTPFDLKSFDPPPARKFALRQLEIMQQGKIRDAARDAVELEVSEARRMEEEALRSARRKAIREGRLPPVLKKSVIEVTQDEESTHILRGLRITGQF
eukprot:TRINITY_DN22600_c0_g1_i1.p1 TRINITY_DN22600_c0_g1~~TRINITY_DN22600_c0_g1_i1.p1  ORF type:complete len:164 (+),score=20.51 TRINITY_DN22600_c0_g1_i1:53-544(+)